MVIIFSVIRLRGGSMGRIRYIVYACLTGIVAVVTLAQDFPEHPTNRKEAEAQGLARVGIDELKAFMPGVVQMQGHKGSAKTKTFKPDGSLKVEDLTDIDKGGSWKFSKKHDGYCNEIRKKKEIDKNCFVVFRAPDGVHYFDFDAKTGFYAAVWRAVPK
jgi:hypothetical protein